MVRDEVDGERMQRWAEAFEDWLEERRARFNQKTGERSYLAWREFMAFCGKAPWEVAVEDVEGHVAELQKRGLTAGTIRGRVACLSRFYEYCQNKGLNPSCEAEFNPAKQARHPRVVNYESAIYLSEAEEAALLETAQRDPSPMGKRDYALILMLVKTGWKSGEVRKLQWKNLEEWKNGRGDMSRGEGRGEEGGKGAVGAATKTSLGCRGEGDRGVGDWPEEVGEAVREYLEATGRWEEIQPEEYVFAPSAAPLLREARERPEDWAGSRPLSGTELRHLVRLHAGRAGLRVKRITPRALRHTAAMRRLESGETAEAVGAFLGRERPALTRAYLKKLKEKPKGRLRARKRATGEETAPSRAPGRAKPGNHLALEHGLTARYLPEFEWLAEQGVEMPEIDWLILKNRIVMRRAMLLGQEVRTLEEAMKILKVMGIAACRLVRAVKLKQESGEGKRDRG